MTELEQLRQRRELVVLAAELQRATVVRRLERIEANPARRVLSFAATAVSRPALLSIGTAALRLAVNAYRRRTARKRALKYQRMH
ncbi:MAG TPA: hypothetical protein VM122_00385 [Usitatibacter sp.]|nr:hypothetical protein [Usitatibacter sp.]